MTPFFLRSKDVDARDKRGHDGRGDFFGLPQDTMIRGLRMMIIVTMRAGSGSNGASTGVAREPRSHLLQHVIAADADPVADDLHVGVAVAEVPCEPHEAERRSPR